MSIYSGSEIIDIAKQIEAAGEAFYDGALSVIKDEKIRAIFVFLRDEERRHGKIFEGLIHQLGEDSGAWRFEDDYLAYMRALADHTVFPNIESALEALKSVDDEKSAIRFAMGFEKDTILYMYSMKKMVVPSAQKMIDEIISEEEGHVRTLNNLMQSLG